MPPSNDSRRPVGILLVASAMLILSKALSAMGSLILDSDCQVANRASGQLLAIIAGAMFLMGKGASSRAAAARVVVGRSSCDPQRQFSYSSFGYPLGKE